MHDFLFPVLAGRGRRYRSTWFRIRRRTKGEYVFTDDTLVRLELSFDPIEWMKEASCLLGPAVFDACIEWPRTEQDACRRAFGLSRPCRICGDSWTLPLFFALRCFTTGQPWPCRTFATGALILSEGRFRCYDIAHANRKLNRARKEGCMLFMPALDLDRLRRRHRAISNGVPVRRNSAVALAQWDAWLAGRSPFNV